MVKTRLMDKVVIVTGASSGIGKATALLLAGQGANVALAARRRDALEQVAGQIEGMGRQALVAPTDVARQDQVECLVQQTLDRWGQVDVLVANAGQYFRSPIADAGSSVFKQAMEINFYGALYTVLAVLPHMLGRDSGHIVLMSTVDGKKGIPPDAPYVAAKFAMAGFGDVLRQELRGSGVGVTTLFPGRVDTPLIDYLKVPWMSAKIPPEAVARAVLRAIERRPAEIILPFQAKLLVYTNALFPGLADWAVRAFHLEGWDMRTEG